MNISKVNLNLLVALNMLLTESNVTRAAEKLFITQAAMSNILKQLRDLFQDQLLIKNGRSLVLTKRAEALQPQIKIFLAHAEEIIQSRPFEPSQSKRSFIIGMDEYSAIVLLPSIYEYVSTHAPGIKILVKNIPLFADTAMLNQKEIELAIGVVPYINHEIALPHDILLSEKLVCIGKPNHPLFKKSISLNDYMKMKHVSYTPISTTPSIVDEVLNKQNYKRDIALCVSHIMPAIYTLRSSNLLATVPTSLANEVKKVLGFSVQHCKIDFPESKLAQIWHPWTLNDSGCMWLRSVVKLLARKLSAP